MMIITRKPGERIVIGEGADRVEVTVARVRGNRVRLGIEAARHVQIDRGDGDPSPPADARPTAAERRAMLPVAARLDRLFPGRSFGEQAMRWAGAYPADLIGRVAEEAAARATPPRSFGSLILRLRRLARAGTSGRPADPA